jgi:hypothetical protein
MANDLAADETRRQRIKQPDTDHRCGKRVGGTGVGAEYKSRRSFKRRTVGWGS